GDFLFIVFSPQQALFTEATLEVLRSLKAALLTVENVDSVDSILDVPLFKLAGATLTDVADNIVTIESSIEALDMDAVRDDLMSNEAYQDVLLSADGRTTALIVNLQTNTALQDLLDQRSNLRKLAASDALDEAGIQQLRQI